MKILLQDARNNLYFRCGNFWTSNPETAFDFRQTRNLFDFVQQNHLQHVQVVVASENFKYWEVLPLERLTSTT